MKELKVNLGKYSYNILIGNGFWKDIPKIVESDFPDSKIFIVTDENVNEIYGNEFESCFSNPCKKIVLKQGEGTKSFESYVQLCNSLLSFGIKRNDLLIAFGGGVIGDLVGFVSATILRGVKFVQVPTTLLAQTDSSIGGKTGINTKFGKNLIGAFNQPQKVFIDTDFLKTLNNRVFSDGMAEVIKCGCIYSENLFLKLNKLDYINIFSEINEIIYECCDIKRYVVEMDEKEVGLRKILNFGHTFGHVIEKAFEYGKYTHGESVAGGMVTISLLGEKYNLTEKGTATRIINVLNKFDLPIKFEKISKQTAEKIMQNDKKATFDSIDFVFISHIGKAFIKALAPNKIINDLDSMDCFFNNQE